MRGKWNGDVNLLDGTSQELREAYDRRRAQADANPSTGLAKEFKEDMAFLKNKLQETVKTYQKKFALETTSKAILKELNWQIVEIVHLLEKARDFFEMHGDALNCVELAGLSGKHLDFHYKLLLKPCSSLPLLCM